MNMAQDWSRDEEKSRNRPFGRHDTKKSTDKHTG